MKIEMGESLFYSWLRHVKECQIVQSNWTTSPQWTLYHEDELTWIMADTEKLFREKYGYDIYKQNASLSQLLQQAECDVLGISAQNTSAKIYAVDVAFHESGLNYGGRKTSVMKIINKCLRTAMCIYGYLNSKEAEIIFASPKISTGILKDAYPCLEDAQEFMNGLGFEFKFRIIANEDFSEHILNPILLVSKGVADTNELFLRSCQMLQMFNSGADPKSPANDSYSELKIGKLAQLAMREALEGESISKQELLNLQSKSYCKRTFNLNLPVLAAADKEYDKRRYYSKQLVIQGEPYALCSQWIEKDRQLLLNWLEARG